MAVKLGFKPKQVTKRLLKELNERGRDVITARFGLGSSTDLKTLEAIGEQYGITRERVRQIENHALGQIRKSDTFQQLQPVFDELAQHIDEMGGIIAEEELFDQFSRDKSVRNHLYFLLELGTPFEREKEDTEFKHRWSIDRELSKQIKTSLRRLYKDLNDDDLIPESELIDRFLRELQEVNQKYKNQEIARRWLGISKTIGRNPLGEWGKSESPNVRAKGMRDFAYLTIKRHGSPMHFREVAGEIQKLFSRRAHVATCHNELIKDERFVLVGRGLYALAEWGYSDGVVKDVIAEILREEGPLTRDAIVQRVKKERYVKDNTIIVNLQDTNRFQRNADGTYSLAQSKRTQRA